jgi:hypothetical protein
VLSLRRLSSKSHASVKPKRIWNPWNGLSSMMYFGDDVAIESKISKEDIQDLQPEYKTYRPPTKRSEIQQQLRSISN